MSYARSDTVIDHVGNEHGLPLEDFEYYYKTNDSRSDQQSPKPRHELAAGEQPAGFKEKGTEG